MKYTENSIVVRDNQEVEENINFALSYTEKEFRVNGVRANLYLTGSLSRKEPTVKLVDRHYRLASDLDYVVVVNNETDIDKLKKVLKNIYLRLSDYLCSFVIIEEKDLDSIHSFFARDLRASLENAIYEGITVTKDTNLEIGIHNYIEAFVGQFGDFFLHPDLTENKEDGQYFKNLEYHRLKLFVECLRLLGADDYVVGYNEIFLKGVYNKISDIMSLEDILKCLKARELNDTSLLPDIDLLDFVQRALKKSFMTDNMLDLVKEVYAVESNPKYLYHNATIALAMSVNSSFENEYLHFFCDSIIKSGIGMGYHDCIARTIDDYVYCKTRHNFENIIVLFRKITNEYTEIVHFYNTSEHIFVDNYIRNGEEG